jgi:hypothetical protein
MRIQQLAVGLLSAAACMSEPAAAADEDNPVWKSLSPEQIKEVIERADGQITSTENSDDGYTITATYPGGMVLYFIAMDCAGGKTPKSCPEYRLEIDFKAKDAATARRFRGDVDKNFVASSVDGDNFVMWRMGFT